MNQHREQSDLSLAIQSLSDEIRHESARMGDFIWKLPTFLQEQERIEIEKLDRYFPGNKALQDLRWEHEVPKLAQTFPRLVAESGLFSVCSFFEWSLCRLAKVVCEHSDGTSLGLEDDCAHLVGRGMYERAIAVLKSHKIRREMAARWPQVAAARKLRNCLIHAGGVLIQVDRPDELRQIVENHQYFSSDDNSRVNADYAAKIMDGPLGPQITLPPRFAHALMPYFVEHFEDMCRQAIKQAP